MEAFDLSQIDDAVNDAFGTKGKASAGAPAASTSPALSQRLDQARAAYRQQYGTDMPISSGPRSREEQQRLFDASKAGAPNVFMPVNPAGQPGRQTFHTDAVDIPTSVPEEFLNQFGIHRPLGTKDPVHAVVMPANEKPVASDNFDPQRIDAAVDEAFSEPPKETTGGKVSRIAKETLLGTGKFAGGVATGAAVGVPKMIYESNKAVGEFVANPIESLKALPQKAGEFFTGLSNVLPTPSEVPGQYDPQALQKGQNILAVGQAAVEHPFEAGQVVGEMVSPGVYTKSAGLISKLGKAGIVKPVAAEPAPAATAAGAPGVAAEAPGVQLRQNAPELQQRYQAEQQAASQGQAPVEPTPTGTARPMPPDAPFAEVKYAETGVPLNEQYARAQTLNRVLGSDHTADLAAIEGKGKERATNYATSNTDTPQGNFLKERFADEQARLADYAERQTKNTGGTVGLDESSVYKRGNTILKPLQDLETHFDNATKKIYADRDAIAKDIPVETRNVLDVLNDESLTLANTETIGLTNIAKARMKQLGMMDKEGNLLPTNAKTAENFRKFLNENWDRKNANLHKQLKAAVDEDVLANLDTNSPLYKEARELVTLRKNTLDNPNGISKILDAEGPKGINRKVDIEKIAQNIADMPVDQFTHVVDTLKNVPVELQPQAGAALSEIKAQFANRIAEQKTPRQLTKYMNDNREVMNRVFTPDEMASLRDYHNAVHILKTDTGYKGAAVQAINIEQKLGAKIGEHFVSKGAALGAEALTGGTTMGGAALVTNELLSRRAAGKRATQLAKAQQEAFQNTQNRFVPIQDLIKK
jgi:hypothetical protein